MAEDKTVTLAGVEVALAPPPQMSVRYEICGAYGKNEMRAMGAALGACWQGSGRPRVRYDQCGYSPLAYGGKVIDELASRGLAMTEILEAGAVAFVLLAEGLVNQEEVDTAAGFSEGGQAA